MLNFFRKKRRLAYVAPRKQIRKRSVAKDFIKQRTGTIKYRFSRAHFHFSRLFKLLAAFSLVIILAVGIISFLFFSTYFSVQHVQLIRKDFRTDIESISPIIEPYRGKNIFFISTGEVENTLRQNFPFVENIEVSKIYPRSLSITISTFPIVARWHVSIIKEQLNEEGNLVEVSAVQKLSLNKLGKVSKGTIEDKEAFLIIEQEVRKSPFKLGEEVVSIDHLEVIQEGVKLLEELLGWPIVSVKYFRAAKEIHFIAENQMEFWVDFASDPLIQINKLRHVIAETDLLQKELAYFDLRVNERIFWKAK